jgi:hypothetical protein
MTVIRVEERISDRVLWAVLALGAAALLFGGCARNVRPDDLSAAQHRAEAEKERAAAEQHLGAYDPKARSILHTTHGGAEGVVVASETSVSYNPTEWQLSEAQRHSRHAKEHEAAAAQLEGFEASECSGFAPSVRAACPVLGPVEQLETLPDGVRFHLAASVDANTALAHMRCHLAYARARGYPETCPLYLKGIEIRSGGPHAVDIVSRDGKVVRAIQRRAQE